MTDEKKQLLDEILLKRALKHRRIYFWGEVDDEIAADAIDQLYFHFENDSKLPVHLLINSVGGSATACEALIDEIDALQKKGLIISTLAQGMAASAAAILLSIGTKGYRFARPNSTIMFHPLSFALEADYADQQKKMTTYLEKKTNRLNLIAATALDKDVKRYIKETKDGLWMTPEEALKHKAIDAILLDTLPVYPEYKYE